MPPRTLVCCASSFGYGPVAKLLAIAQALRDRPVKPRLVFVGTDIAYELAARANVFDEVMFGAPETARVRQAVRSGDGLLSVMDRHYFPLAQDADIALFAVDSLFWLRQPVPESIRIARRAFVQDFDGVRQRLGQTAVRAEIVGPIVRSLPSAPPRSDRRLVVNLGGGESPYGSLEHRPGYADLAVRAILTSELATRFDRQIVLISGQRLSERLGHTYPGCGIDFRSVSHDQALSLLGSATLVVTSPGLTTSLECFQLSTPTYFLPPQNSSQWWILDVFRRHELAPISLHWDDLEPRRALPRLLPQDVRETIVREIVGPLMTGSDVASRLARVLSRIAHTDHDALVARQRRYFDSLGANGATVIAEALATWLRDNGR